jgi:hypothetical protein
VRNNGRQPASQILDVADVGPAQPNPGFLDGILRFARRPEHAIRHHAQLPQVCFELRSQPLSCIHSYRILQPVATEYMPVKEY